MSNETSFKAVGPTPCSARPLQTKASMHLLVRISNELSKLKVEVELSIPFDKGELVAHVHDEGEVLHESYTETGTHLVARLGHESLAAFREYLEEAPA